MTSSPTVAIGSQSLRAGPVHFLSHLYSMYLLLLYQILLLKSNLSEILKLYSMPEQTDHPPESKFCTCPRLCNGGKWVNRRTYARHKQHCDEDIARRHEQHYA